MSAEHGEACAIQFCKRPDFRRPENATLIVLDLNAVGDSHSALIPTLEGDGNLQVFSPRDGARVYTRGLDRDRICGWAMPPAHGLDILSSGQSVLLHRARLGDEGSRSHSHGAEEDGVCQAEEAGRVCGVKPSLKEAQGRESIYDYLECQLLSIVLEEAR